MKYPIEAYAEAFCEAALERKGKEEELIKKFLVAVNKNGDWGEIKKIFKLIARKMAVRRGGRFVSVEFGRAPTKKVTLMLEESFSKKDHVEFKVRPELIAGARILINGEQELDSTLIKKINKLFI
ncbi:MAG: F0F1 ATP synthase subunit delta [bacterium]|nr:F0F1 ATP synthase subunit delta [bacterium]